MAKTFTVENPEALTSALRALENIASEQVLRQAAVAGARVIFAEVKLRAPVGNQSWEGAKQQRYPGYLRERILIAYDKAQSLEGKIASYIVTWSREAFYGRFIEYGSSRMAAQPFLRPGYEAKKAAAAEAVDGVIQAKVKELGDGQ